MEKGRVIQDAMRRRESGAIENGGSVVNARKKLAGAGSWQRLTPPPLGCRHRSPAVLSETGTTETCAAMRCSAVRTWWNSASPSGYIEQHQTGSCYAVRRSDNLQYNICLPITQKTPITCDRAWMHSCTRHIYLHCRVPPFNMT